MTKILVTGAPGFIGQNLMPKLNVCGYETLAVGRSEGDIADKSTWINFERADVLIHLAGSAFVPDSWKDPSGFMKANLYGTVCALDYCRQHNAKFIYLSSYLYGNPRELPIPESALLVANNPYALSKKLAEEACEFYANFYGVKVVIFRPFNVYGPGQSKNFLIPSIIKQICVGDTVCVKDLNPRRDYIYIDDLVDAIVKAVNGQLDFDIFNIGTGQSYSVAELIDIIQKIKGTSLKVHSDSERRLGEVMDTQAEIKKAMNILDWRPKYSLQAGLEKMIRLI